MTADKIRALAAAEINPKLAEAQEEMFRLRLQLRMGRTDSLKKLRELKKDRARMLTILNEKKKAEK
jgi:large subunit ribosomal protein L29